MYRTRLNNLAVLVTATLVFLTAGISAALAAPRLNLPDPVLSDRLTPVFNEPDLVRLLHYCDIPGLSLAVINDGEVSYCHAYGVRNLETGESVDTETVFAAASLGKPLFAYIVMRLAERGEFDLDRPLAEILRHPDAKNDRRYGRITARMILSHTSGMVHNEMDRFGLAFNPGERFGYSPPGITYLQKAVEKETGKDLSQLADEEVFQPLGMERSAYHYRDSFGDNVVCGHGLLGPVSSVKSFTKEREDAAYTLLTTAGDYAKFMLAMSNGPGLSPEARDEMLTPQVQVFEGNAGQPVENVFWGLGWGLQTGINGRAFWHWGDIDKFTGYAIMFPDSGRGLVYMANSDAGLAIGRELLSLVTNRDFNGLDMLAVADYDSPGWGQQRAQMRQYLLGDIAAGEGLYYDAEEPAHV